MTNAVLVVGTGRDATAASRFPRALTPRGRRRSHCSSRPIALARHTRHVVRVGVVAPDAPSAKWIEALFALIDVAAPRAIVPADADALAFVVGLARRRRRRFGRSVSQSSQTSSRPALGPLDRLAASARTPGARGDGASYTHHVAAHRGRVVACASAEHVVVDLADGDRPTVLRFCVHDGIAALGERAVASIVASGFLALDVVVSRHGEPRLAGVERHAVATAHVSQWLGVDLAGAWLAALDGRAPSGATSLAPGTSRLSTTFPQEWRRDRESRWLREQRVDVPWDDPEVARTPSSPSRSAR